MQDHSANSGRTESRIWAFALMARGLKWKSRNPITIRTVWRCAILHPSIFNVGNGYASRHAVVTSLLDSSCRDCDIYFNVPMFSLLTLSLSSAGFLADLIIPNCKIAIYKHFLVLLWTLSGLFVCMYDNRFISGAARAC